MNISNSKNIIEALMFVSGEPLSFVNLQKKIGINKDELRKIINGLAEDYKERGVNILEFENTVEMVTSPEVSETIRDFIKSELQEDLSPAALETLAIIAYRGPVSRAQVEDIRGVNCIFILRNLLIRGLIKRENNPEDARSYIYSITADFLKKLGLKSLSELPEYEKFK